MSWLNTHHLAVGGARVSYAALLVALLVVVAGFILASKVSSRIRALGGDDARLRWRAVAAQIVGYTLRVATVAVALQVTGIDVASILAAGTVLAVGIGIAMQKVAENFVSGIILFAERSIREGDIIEFEGRVAKVRHMGIRATIALTLDDEEIIVPNSILAQSAVKNLTLTDVVYRLRVKVGVSYDSDVDRATEVLKSAAEVLSWREPSREPIVLLMEFASSSIDFEVSVWTRDVWALRRGQSELRKTLWRALRGAGITIPFPQLDVHLPNSVKPSEVAHGR
jgi:potassium-dependent mechanosensitive channel